MGYSLVNVEDVPGEGPGNAVRFVRRRLGCEAFGINWFEIPPNAEGREHDESNSAQEEVNVIIRGSGVYRVEGELVPVEEGTFLRFDPETTRQAVKTVGGRVPLESSGGITLETVRDFAEAGVDYISVGALTHSAPAVDIHLRITPE